MNNNISTNNLIHKQYKTVIIIACSNKFNLLYCPPHQKSTSRTLCAKTFRRVSLSGWVSSLRHRRTRGGFLHCQIVTLFQKVFVLFDYYITRINWVPLTVSRICILIVVCINIQINPTWLRDCRSVLGLSFVLVLNQTQVQG